MTDRTSYSFARRFLIYQKERFPFMKNGLVIAVFTFSAISYSILSRGAEGFIPLSDYLIAVFETVSFFFLVRLFDEEKDKEDDAKYRPYLPVPRGLIRLKELRFISVVVIVLQILVIILFQPGMIFLHFLILGFLLLMRFEFFVPDWLRKRQMAYITSHMLIIPLIDLYASGLDWKLSEEGFHTGLIWFFAVSYFNGLTLEFGRKIRTKDSEEEGVVSYTALFGLRGGPAVWAASMFTTLIMAIGASLFAGFDILSVILLIIFYIGCVLPGLLFIKAPTTRRAKYIESSSALWTLFMYLILGATPMIKQLLF
ncbi:MAG: UbiA family prenyltransferase [Brumimicrobium sp.]|nr:UbiA family prenyltransferase [Brumimicrobium sp.]